MPTSPSWRPAIAELRGPRYLAIAEALSADLATGRLKPGDLLPTQRELASALDVDLTTVTRAYGEARRRGLIEAVVGRGTYVRAPGASVEATAARRASLDLTMNLPPQPPEARLGERLAAALAAVQRQSDFLSLLSYRPSAGGEEDRAAGASWLAGRLGAVAPERVLVCAGAQAAMLVGLGTLMARGARVACEAVTYSGFRALAQQLGLAPVGVAIDDEGLIPEALDAVCRQAPVQALYCVPTIHNPTTATMSAARRAAIAEVARHHALTIFEDDAYGMLATDAPPALASFAPERSVYVAGMAKCLAPGLRIAYLVAPDHGAAARLAAGMRATTLMTAPLLAGVATRWILDGTAPAITAAIRDESAARQRLAAAILPAGSFRAHAEGHHLWLDLPESISRIEFAGHMRQQGLAVVASDAFAVTAPAPSAVRVSLGGMARAEVRPALTRLAEAIARGEPLAEVI